MEGQLDNRCRCLHCVNIVLDLFPKILQRIMESSGIPSQSLFNIIHKDYNFKKKLTQSDYHTIQTLLNDGYNKLDVTLIFKIITHFSNMFLTPPTRGWASNPQPNEITIGDDAQRLRLTRNHFFHKVEATITDAKYNEFFNEINKICERLDTYLKLTIRNSFISLLQSFLVPPWERLPDIEQQYKEQQSLKEFLIIDIGNRKFTVYQTGSMKEFIQALNNCSEDPVSEELTEPITLTFPEITDLDVVKQVEEELKDEINSGLVNIKIIRAAEGSLVLDIAVRKTVLMNDEEFKQELGLVLQTLLKHEKIQRLSQTRHAVISENYGFCSEQDEDDLSDARVKTGGLKLHLQVKSAILHSEEALKGEVQHLLGAMASKTNGSQIFQTEPVLAVLEPDTQEFKRSNSNNTTIGCKRNADIQKLVKSLSLQKYFPGKITLQKVRAMQLNDVPLTKENLPWLLLMKLIVLNINAREEDLKKLAEEYDDDVDLLNPMDLFLVTFLSCNPILQQEIILKMIQCRHAIPFMYRDFSNTLRWSKLSMKKILVPEHTDKGIKIVDALHHKGKIVSFVRVGNISVSKSKLLNNVLSENSCSTFFNRDCPLGITERLIASGIIEASWYIPKDDSSGFFNEAIMFLNLRGDAMEHSDEFAKMLQLSNVVVVLTNEQQKNDPLVLKMLSVMSKDGLLIYALETEYKKRQFEEKITKKLSTFTTKFFNLGSPRHHSLIDVAKDIRKVLGNVLQVSTGKRLIDNLQVLGERDNYGFKEAENLSSDFQAVLKKYPKVERNIFVPTQGKLWHDYSLAYKAHFKFKADDEKRKLEEEMVNIRSQQLQMQANGVHPLMELFCRHIEQLCQMDQTQFSIYIEWIMSYIDDRSRFILPERLKKYNNCWKKMKLAKEKHKSSEYDALRQQLRKSEEDLIGASFGLEHLIRELGQMYEVTKHSESKFKFNQAIFVDFACKILQYGYPFEIMDGDTAMIPLTWVKAVLNRLIEVIGDEKVLAISVLGIQSSGKSTLLNAMFGLKFPVRAGRCTRGVYIQLVKVDNNNLPFSHILVIDTEGLRAPELEHQSHSHDNELATFVIGLGDITIINIKGENTSELEDILQIAVHALLRLKMANSNLIMNHTCIFTHQNVSAITAMSADRYGRHKMMDRLDEMTSEAANQEGLFEITTYNQVIEFDPDLDVFYFSDLFIGDPPMAPVNIWYSNKVEEVRSRLINEIAVKKRLFLTLSETITRIEDLWKGILTEDFVFSFRNTLEVKAYHLMETEFFKLTSSIDDFIYRYIREDVRNKLVSCENNEQLILQANYMQSELFGLMANKLIQAVYKWNDFIDICSLREIVEQWRESRCNKLMEYHIGLRDEVQRAINEIKQECSAYLVRKHGNKHYEREIKEKAISLAKEHQGKRLSSAALDEIFEAMWNEWLTSLIDDTSVRNVSVKDEVNRVLIERFASDSNIIGKELIISNDQFQDDFFFRMPKLTGNFSSENIIEDDPSLAKDEKSLLKKGAKLEKNINFWSPKKDIRKQGIDDLDVIFHAIDTYILGITKGDGNRFDRSYIMNIFDLLINSIDSSKLSKTGKFNIPKKLKVKIVVFVARYITAVFIRLDDTYKKNNSIETHMSKYKITLKQQFLGIVKEENDAVTIGKSVGKVETVNSDHGMKIHST